MNITKATSLTLAGLLLGYGIWATRNIDGDTGLPVRSEKTVIHETPDPLPERTAPRVWTPPTPIQAEPPTDAYYMGDDNADGRIDEDESGWNCHTMGNRICGPGQG